MARKMEKPTREVKRFAVRPDRLPHSSHVTCHSSLLFSSLIFFVHREQQLELVTPPRRSRKLPHCVAAYVARLPPTPFLDPRRALDLVNADLRRPFLNS